jgi:hypothetical protein
LTVGVTFDGRQRAQRGLENSKVQEERRGLICGAVPMATRGWPGLMKRHPGGAVPTPPPEPTAVIDAAIATVLATEQAARGSIAAATAGAGAIVATARGAARRIAARAAQRSARVHDVLQQRLDRALAQVESRRQALRAVTPEPNEQQVTTAARALARQLTTRAGS